MDIIDIILFVTQLTDSKLLSHTEVYCCIAFIEIYMKSQEGFFLYCYVVLMSGVVTMMLYLRHVNELFSILEILSKFALQVCMYSCYVRFYLRCPLLFCSTHIVPCIARNNLGRLINNELSIKSENYRYSVNDF